MRFNYGAGNRDRLHSAFRYGTALVSGMMILGTLTVNLFPVQLLELFTASEAMRSFGISAMRIMAASYLFCGLSTMISTYFQATEKVGSSIAIQLCRQLLFLVPALGKIERQQLGKLLFAHRPRSSCLCRTLSGRFATDCARSCSFASTEGRLALSSTDAEYSLKAAFKASVSCALK